jgi:dihydrofolate reductase
MGKVTLYIATSLDGFIARPDGNLDWLTSTPAPQDGDYGYSDLLGSIGTILMGRKTYEEVIGFGIDWPYIGFDSYVISTKEDLKIQSPDTHLISKDLRDFVLDLKNKSEKDIWLVGGGQLVTTFINEELLDKMIITIIPKLIGEGIPLFPNKSQEMNWKLIDTQAYDTSVVCLTYERAE